ncbi:MAG: discoidin domain-containing protein, partial [Verrucomicrobiota bacterium]
SAWPVIHSYKVLSRKTPWTAEELHASVPHVLSNRKGWKLSASHGEESVKHAIDGESATRFTTGRSMTSGMWLQVELPETTPIAGLVLDAGRSKNDYPRGYEIHFSQDGKTWGEPVAVGQGETAMTEIGCQEQEARFVRITQTGAHRLYWSIHNLEILTGPSSS